MDGRGRTGGTSKPESAAAVLSIPLIGKKNPPARFCVPLALRPNYHPVGDTLSPTSWGNLDPLRRVFFCAYHLRMILILICKFLHHPAAKINVNFSHFSLAKIVPTPHHQNEYSRPCPFTKKMLTFRKIWRVRASSSTTTIFFRVPRAIVVRRRTFVKSFLQQWTKIFCI